MGYGIDFLIGGRFGVIGGWTKYHEGYHKFQVDPIHGLTSLAMYGLGFWSFECPLLPPPGRPLPPLPRKTTTVTFWKTTSRRPIIDVC